MIIDYRHQLIITAECANHDQKKSLTQKERKLLLVCCEALSNTRTRDNLEKFEKKQQIIHLIKKLKQIPKKKKASCYSSLNSFFKAIANIFHLRLGIERLNKKIHEAYKKSLRQYLVSTSFPAEHLKRNSHSFQKELKQSQPLNAAPLIHSLIEKKNEIIFKNSYQLNKENRTHEFTENYKELLEDIESVKRDEKTTDGSIEDLDKKNDHWLHVKNTVNGFDKIGLFHREIWQYFQSHTHLESLFFISELTGLVIHTEIKENNLEQLLLTAAPLLFNSYRIAKEKNRLHEFFTQAFTSKDVCFEARYDQLLEWCHLEEKRENPALTLIPPKLTINPTKTKVENIYALLRDFEELAARKYAQKNNIKVDIGWIEANGPKFQIQRELKFRNYYNKANFLDTLFQNHILEKKCLDGIFSKKDLVLLVDKLVKEDSLYP